MSKNSFHLISRKIDFTSIQKYLAVHGFLQKNWWYFFFQNVSLLLATSFLEIWSHWNCRLPLKNQSAETATSTSTFSKLDGHRKYCIRKCNQNVMNFVEWKENDLLTSLETKTWQVLETSFTLQKFKKVVFRDNSAYGTVWKLQNVYITQILCEINFR